MTHRIRIQKTFSSPINILKKKLWSVRMPYVDVLVSNPYHPDGKRDNPSTERFLVDSGAAITVLNSKFTDLLQNTPKEDEITIQYGQGKSHLPVYRVELRIQGYRWETIAAYDANLKTDSLLGHTFLAKHFDIVTFDFKGRLPITKLIKG